MLNQFSRTQLLYGQDNMRRLAASRVAVFGIGGVGGYVVEALARSGVGALDLIDDDRVCITTSIARSSPPGKPWENTRWTRRRSASGRSTRNAR